MDEKAIYLKFMVNIYLRFMVNIYLRLMVNIYLSFMLNIYLRFMVNIHLSFMLNIYLGAFFSAIILWTFATQGKLLLLLQTFTTQEYLKQSLKETLNAEISCQDETVFRKEKK